MRSYHCSNTNGKYQEQESAPLVREFLADTGITATQIDRVANQEENNKWIFM